MAAIIAMSNMKQELPTFPEHLSSHPVLIDFAQSLGFRVMFCGSLFVLFSLGHYIVCPSSIYGF